MSNQRRFHSPSTHGFVRVAVGIPAVRVADPAYNAEQTLLLARRAHDGGAVIILFPELGLSAYSNEDLFHQDALLEKTRAALEQIVKASASLGPVLLVGAPWRVEGGLYNCAFVIHHGHVLGVVPKSYLPNYREFYEKRQFTSGRDAVARETLVAGKPVPFGRDLIFAAANIEGCKLHVEICEDVWTPIPPSTYAALAGATILANLSASNITIGKAEYRRTLCTSQSARCLSAYLYSAAGPGESTTDLAWDGHALICENNEVLAESERFADQPQLVSADIDLERLRQERMRTTSFNDSADDCRERLQALRAVPFTAVVPANESALQRTVGRFPYVPHDPQIRDKRCSEAYHIQVHGLLQRLAAINQPRVILGVSGGLDSTQALLVAAHTMDRLHRPRGEILAYTMPGFATSEHTLRNAHRLMKALGVTAGEIDIKPSCLQMFRDIGHPFAAGKPVYDVTFENVQAGERTSHLFRLANHHRGIVLGTGDLSELAMGWMTYGVGDHMSHYNVNVSVPKTLIQHLIRWVARSGQFDAATSETLESIVNTEISPELVPHVDGDARQPAQRTIDAIGPYDLVDFFLYYVTRFGFRPSKVAYLAHQAWGDCGGGLWPDLIPNEHRVAYDLATIRKWLGVFLERFFQTSQFKRTAIPNGPKVGSGGSLSPRGDWRAPSDSTATVWLEELRENVPAK